MKFLFSIKRDIIFVMRFEEKNSKNGVSLLFRVLNPNIEAQKQKEKIFEKSVTIFILHVTWRL